MRTLKIIIIVFSLTTFVNGCLFTKGHFTDDGSMWVWKKDPSGKYNSHNPLQVDKANKWIETVLKIPKLRTLKIEVFSKKLDHYIVNDSIMFFNLNNKELPNYHSYYTFSERLDSEPDLLKAIVNDFESLELNRFYKEDEFLAFHTVTYLGCCSKGYFYFTDSTASAKMSLGDTLDFKSAGNLKNFREAMFSRFIVTNKFGNRWVEWEESN